MEVRDLLLQTPIFEGCSKADVDQLLQSPHAVRAYDAGAIVVKIGDECRSLMVLLEGSVEARMGGEEGREVVIDRHRAPAILAPAFLFATRTVMPVEVTAVAFSHVLFLNRDGFFTFMQGHPVVLHRFLQVISDRAQMLSQKVRGFAVTGLRGRVMTYLEKFGAIENVSETAERLGVARPSLSRLLAEMVSDGTVENTAKGYVRKT